MATRREIELARCLRRRATPAERAAWEIVRDRRCQGFKFKRQHPLGEFIVDLYCPALQLVIELDGSIHADPDQAAKDELRTAELESLGVTVVRLKNQDVSLVSIQRIVSSQERSPSPRDCVERGSGGEAGPIIFPPCHTPPTPNSSTP